MDCVVIGSLAELNYMGWVVTTATTGATPHPSAMHFCRRGDMTTSLNDHEMGSTVIRFESPNISLRSIRIYLLLITTFNLVSMFYVQKMSKTLTSGAFRCITQSCIATTLTQFNRSYQDTIDLKHPCTF